METDKVVLYPSINKAALAFHQNAGVIGMYNEQVWTNRYAIKVLTQSINQLIKFLMRHSSVAFESEAVLDNESEAPKRKPAAVSCTPSRTSEFLVDGIR